MALGQVRLGLVGAGKMGGAMLSGWLDQGLKAANVWVLDPGIPDDIMALSDAKGFAFVGSVSEVEAFPNACPDILVVAVKPQLMDQVLPNLVPLVGPATVIVSVAAGTKIEAFQAHFGESTPVVRAMPNTPAQVGRGMTAGFASATVSAAAKEVVASLLGATGAFVWVESEEQIDAVTAISGSGPAYLFHMVEAMTDAGRALGLASDVAAILARQTVIGAGELLYQSDLGADILRQNVTSPGGTTAAALAVLMRDEQGLRSLVEEATKAARDRSVALSQ